MKACVTHNAIVQQMSSVKTKLNEILGMPSGKQKIQFDVSACNSYLI